MATATLTSGAALAGLAERAGWTFLQVFLGGLITANSLDLSVAQAAALAAVPAGLSVLLNAVRGWSDNRALDQTLRTGTAWFVDLLQRTAATYALAAGGAWMLSGRYDLSTVQVALYGAIPAALAVIKAAVARRVGDPGSAATLPGSLDPAAPVPVLAAAR
ncbi:hypothetical protein [Embleya sp. NPDC001921]